MKRLTVLLVSMLLAVPMFAQVESFDALKADYPKLMAKFGGELQGLRADYIFAIDVSGTMSKYKETVVPALCEFFKSLQEGDYVSVIKFGGEAVNEVGSAAKINQQTVNNLINYAGHVYDKPQTEYEREKYFRWTDLDNMLHYLADDMHQIGRSKLKFVFIITDFLHDPSPARRGEEDWAGVAQRLDIEQVGNDIHVFALQLPGTGRDLDKVRSVFPQRFDYQDIQITNGSALSDWFTQRKNAILLDKFKALIGSKIGSKDVVIDPNLNIDGRVKLGVSWNPNPVYDCIRIDDAVTTEKVFEFKASLPKKTKHAEDILDAGKLSLNDVSILKPRFKRVTGDIKATAHYDVPYEDELSKLGYAAPEMYASATVSRWLFCYPLPLWAFLTIIALILLYIILVIRAFSRNASDFYRINGKFEVTSGGMPVTERKKAAALEKVDFGRGASFLPVPDSNWALQIEVKRFNPFLRPLKHPEYIVSLTKGSWFKMGAKYGPHQHPSIPRHTHITVGDFRIRWIQ